MDSQTTPTIDSQTLPPWRQDAKLRNLAFYADAIAHNELHVVEDKSHTTNKANCDVCLAPQAPGILKFRYIASRGSASFWFHPCAGCWDELVNETPIQLLIGQQVTTNAIS